MLLIEEVPGYEILGVLGRGGMGVVYRARQLSLKRQVALKMILSGSRAGLDERTRFQAEAEAVARLQHPNIVQIHEIGQHNGMPYFSLEFINAGSLAQFLGGKAQAPEQSARLIQELAKTVHYAHQRGIIHRDLKPGNILLHLDESRLRKPGGGADGALVRDLSAYTPKISDFGLAKHLEGDQGLTGAIVGTLAYMAPEQAHGDCGEVGPAADVYALGAILYELLTGQPPFLGATSFDTAEQVLTQAPALPTRVRGNVPRDLEIICLTCLHKDPRRRYANAELLAEDLRRFLAREPILARPAGPLRRWMQGRHSAVMGWAIAGVLLVSMLGLGATMLVRLNLERDQARETNRQNLRETLQVLERLQWQALESQDPATERWRRLMLHDILDHYQDLLVRNQAELEPEQVETLQEHVASLRTILNRRH